MWVPYVRRHADLPALTALHCAFASQRSQENNYVLADDMVRFIHDDWEVHPGVTLPPINPIICERAWSFR